MLNRFGQGHYQLYLILVASGEVIFFLCDDKKHVRTKRERLMCNCATFKRKPRSTVVRRNLDRFSHSHKTRLVRRIAIGSPIRQVK